MLRFSFAEREGFEPSVPVRVQRFSRPSRSTAPASFQTERKLGRCISKCKVNTFFGHGKILAWDFARPQVWRQWCESLSCTTLTSTACSITPTKTGKSFLQRLPGLLRNPRCAGLGNKKASSTAPYQRLSHLFVPLPTFIGQQYFTIL